MNANPDHDASDPEVQQVAALARTALSSKGLYEVPVGVTPDLLIEFAEFVRLSAREAPERCSDRPPREVWSVIATNVDACDDLDRYLPVLVAAAMDDIATDHPTAREVALSTTDERVSFVRRGL